MQKALKTRFIVTLLTASAVSASAAGELWINEFHYDDSGSDSGEFVEIVVPSSFTDLASVTLTLYNGGDGRTYATHSLGTFEIGIQSEGLTFYSKLISGIQNGAPDGMALTWSEGTQFISYEGSFVAANGPAAGLTSFDIGVAQADTGAPDGSSLGLVGTGERFDDFVWSILPNATPGGLNLGQSVTVVPEPRSYVLFAAGSLGLLAVCRARNRRGGTHAGPALRRTMG